MAIFLSGQPWVNTYGSDPRDPDTDDGSVSDGDEVANGTDPLDPTDDVIVEDPDTGDTGDTGTRDTGTPDTGTPGVSDYYKGGCTCSSSPEPSRGAWLGLAVGLAAVARRRIRRS